jgi:hypothetical protein
VNAAGRGQKGALRPAKQGAPSPGAPRPAAHQPVLPVTPVTPSVLVIVMRLLASLCWLTYPIGVRSSVPHSYGTVNRLELQHGVRGARRGGGRQG